MGDRLFFPPTAFERAMTAATKRVEAAAAEARAPIAAKIAQAQADRLIDTATATADWDIDMQAFEEAEAEADRVRARAREANEATLEACRRRYQARLGEGLPAYKARVDALGQEARDAVEASPAVQEARLQIATLIALDQVRLQEEAAAVSAEFAAQNARLGALFGELVPRGKP